ncbi:MAG: hypothetical protein H7123_08310 [Thermoleophilia bacterium]|nr:hypothetical protein [Thermoleophilia bacterium]
MELAPSGTSPVRYLGLIAEAHDAASRASSRVSRLVADVQSTPLADLGQARLVGAVGQADESMQLIAAAERYRLHADIASVPRGAVRYALQAIEDLESGSRALRRATALIADPEIDQDPSARDATIRSIALADSHYRMAEWLLQQAPTATDGSPLPDIQQPAGMGYHQNYVGGRSLPQAIDHQYAH